MRFFDKIKGLLKKNKKPVTNAVDKASDLIESKVGEAHADKVEAGAEKVKDVIEKID